MTGPDAVQYTPELYQVRSTVVTLTGTSVMLLPLDFRRVMLRFQRLTNTATLQPPFYGTQINGSGTSFLSIGTQELHLFFDNWYTLCCQQWFAADFNVADVFSVTEVIRNHLPTGDLYNAPRKPESLATKIKRYLKFR